jgi:hypothetical protein
LVIGFLAGTISRCIVSYVVCFYKPKLSFDFAKAKELFRKSPICITPELAQSAS